MSRRSLVIDSSAFASILFGESDGDQLLERGLPVEAVAIALGLAGVTLLAVVHHREVVAIDGEH